MSAGGMAGLAFTLMWACGLWAVIGYVIDVLNNALNAAISTYPAMQDAVDMFGLLGVGWSAILIVIFIVAIFNYVANEAAMAEVS